MPKSIVIDALSLQQLQYAELPHNWFGEISGDSFTDTIGVIHQDDIVYILHRNTSIKDRFLVIAAYNDEILGQLDQELRPESFSRIIRAALSVMETSIEMPFTWRCFKSGSLISFQSNHKSTDERARVSMDLHPGDTNNIFVYNIDRSGGNLNSGAADWKLFNDSVGGIQKALNAAKTHHTSAGDEIIDKGLDLTSTLTEGFSRHMGVSAWYESKLTKEQRNFVDCPMIKSVRLRGPAGSGKTLAMIVKCLREIYSCIDNNEKCRFAFITHSTATVELVHSIFSEIDERGVLYQLPSGIVLNVITLQELANDAMSYDLVDLVPLSNDGMEGRKLQMELLSGIIAEYKNGDWITHKEECSEMFKSAIESDMGSRTSNIFIWEVLNEFACVLDAEGIRDSSEKRSRYLNNEESRRKWMMHLRTRDEREVILDLYTEFRRQLREMRAIGVDQMIADYLGYLDSFRWDNIRENDGYNAVFVDELHLFNRQERMVFHYLTIDPIKPPVVLLAYDAKQSPRDTFVKGMESDGVSIESWRMPMLGSVEKFELQDVFRYTPQIAKALASIDQNFPAVDFEEEWPAFNGVSQVDDGPVPVCVELKDIKDIYNVVFPRAMKFANEIKKGKKVAILTLSEELFSIYLNAGQHKKKFLPIVSRDDLSNMAYAGKRFIFSMPEYVAGLQFDFVFLIDVNRGEYGEAESAGAKRRFVSQIYLGASRAEQRLEIYASKERGGLSDILDFAINDGALVTVTPGTLPKY